MSSWAWIPTAIAAAGAAARVGASFLGPGNRLERRIRRHIDLLEHLPAGSDKAQLAELIDQEVAKVVDRDRRWISRKLDGGNLAAMIVVSVLGAALATGAWVLGVHLGGWLKIALGILSALILLATLLFAGIGGGTQLWKSDDAEEPSPDG